MKYTPTFETFALNEDAKDEMRINDIVTKSGGDVVRKSTLAAQMAKSITDKGKARRRYEAARDILGNDDLVTAIFAKRAIELGDTDIVLAKPLTASDVKPSSTDNRPLFTYSAEQGKSVFNAKFLPIAQKLRGYNWGNYMSNKVNTVFNLEERFNLVIYVEREIQRHRLSNWGPKVMSAFDRLRRMTLNPAVLKTYDFGDAKSNKDNVAHFFFETERQEDVRREALDELKAACSEAYANRTKHSNLFEVGEAYTSYFSQKSGNSKIYFDDPWGLYFWNHNMIGQMSDGAWENSRKYQGEWKFWTSLLPVFDPSAKFPDPSERVSDLMNPKSVQQYALQSLGEFNTAGKIAQLKDKTLLPLIKYGTLYSIDKVASIAEAQKIADNYSIPLENFLAFLYEPGIPENQMKKIVSLAHDSILRAMRAVAMGYNR